jgi:hypothetical protein
MEVRNLVLEIRENESAAEVQARFNEAAEDGFFLVNVVGRLAFLRTSVMQKKDSDADDTKAVEFLKTHWEMSDRNIQKAFMAHTGIDRSFKWFQRRRKDKALLKE